MTTLQASLPDFEPPRTRVAGQLDMLLPLLNGGRRYLELGCGDAAVTFAMASHVRQAFGLDLSEAAIDARSSPENFRFLKTDGVHIPLPSASVDLVYSNRLMEPLRPDDAEAQLREVARVLAPGGRYLRHTPKDYRSLRALMKAAGFRSVNFLVGALPRAPMPYAVARLFAPFLDLAAVARR